MLDRFYLTYFQKPSLNGWVKLLICGYCRAPLCNYFIRAYMRPTEINHRLFTKPNNL